MGSRIPEGYLTFVCVGNRHVIASLTGTTETKTEMTAGHVLKYCLIEFYSRTHFFKNELPGTSIIERPGQGLYITLGHVPRPHYITFLQAMTELASQFPFLFRNV